MDLIKCILTANDCYQTGRTITPKGVMVHSTGADNPMLRRYVQPLPGEADYDGLMDLLGKNPNGNHWNRAGTNACVHAFVGKLADGSVAAVQTLPWNHRGWHAGTGTSSKSANDTHISFEICEDGLADPGYFARVYWAAVELTAYLCKEYGLDPLADGAVICHAEGYRRGVASGHADVEHWFPQCGKTMDDFRADVAAAMVGGDNDNDEEDYNMVRYKRLCEISDKYHFRAIVDQLMTAGVISGDGSDKTGNNDVIDLSHDMVRMLVFEYRAGVYDAKLRSAGLDPDLYK
ncbi:MAG: N-acetylmuramoyl-L-alanine amidase family protein [Candidatus Enterenecus sp.]